MSQLTVKPRPSARLVWFLNMALGALLTTWGGFSLMVLLRYPPGRAAALWFAALVLAGLGVSLAVFLREIGHAVEEPPPGPGPSPWTTAALGPDRRADRPHVLGARTRRPHSRFRNPGF